METSFEFARHVGRETIQDHIDRKRVGTLEEQDLVLSSLASPNEKVKAELVIRRAVRIKTPAKQSDRIEYEEVLVNWPECLHMDHNLQCYVKRVEITRVYTPF